MSMRKLLALLFIFLFCAIVLFFLYPEINFGGNSYFNHEPNIPAATTTQDILGGELPKEALVKLDYYIGQTFNNCSVAALAMTLDYYGIRTSQEALAVKIRPHNNRDGNNDDKSTVFEELEREVRNYGFTPYYRPGGDIERLKQFTAHGFPVIVRTLLEADGDYLHFRVVTGYDEVKGKIIQTDSMQGKNLYFSYDDFLAIWKQFNYQYMVIARDEKEKATIEHILAEEIDPVIAWQHARKQAQKEIVTNPEDTRAQFNHLVAQYYLGNYEDVVHEFEAIESKLSRRVIWYQIEPILAYFELGNDERVFELSDRILNDNNKAFSELYLLRGEIYKKNGDIARAREEFEKAVLYNNTLPEAKEALDSLLGSV